MEVLVLLLILMRTQPRESLKYPRKSPRTKIRVRLSPVLRLLKHLSSSQPLVQRQPPIQVRLSLRSCPPPTRNLLLARRVAILLAAKAPFNFRSSDQYQLGETQRKLRS